MIPLLGLVLLLCRNRDTSPGENLLDILILMEISLASQKLSECRVNVIFHLK